MIDLPYSISPNARLLPFRYISTNSLSFKYCLMIDVHIFSMGVILFFSSSAFVGIFSGGVFDLVIFKVNLGLLGS